MNIDMTLRKRCGNLSKNEVVKCNPFRIVADTVRDCLAILTLSILMTGQHAAMGQGKIASKKELLEKSGKTLSEVPLKTQVDDPPQTPLPKEPKTKPSTASKKVSAKSGKAARDEEDNLVEIDFSTAQRALLEDGAQKELDETPDGKKRLRELVSHTKNIFQERTETDLIRRPLTLERDVLAGEIYQYNQGIAQAQQAISQAQNKRRQFETLIRGGDNSQATADSIRACDNQIFMANALIQNNQSEIASRAPELNALNIQIAPLESKLLSLWNELNLNRKSWLELSQPQLKYAQGNYESLKNCISEWVLIDSQWPDAFCWVALCDYELGNYDEAWNLVERTGEMRKTLGFRKAWAQGEALRGLISARISSKRGKSAGYMQTASQYVTRDKNSNWMTYFLMGRAAVENEKLAIKAKTNFEKTLKINEDALCATYWLALLQATTTTPAARDTEAGIKALENLWIHSNKRSWRLAKSMTFAYDAAKRQQDAEVTWETVRRLAPAAKHAELEAERAANLAKHKSAETEEGGSKIKKSGPSQSKGT